MLIIKNKSRLSFIPEGESPTCSLVDMYRDANNKITYVYNVTIPVKTQDIVDQNIRKINILINAQALKTELTTFEKIAFNGATSILGKSGGNVIEERKRKASTMDILTQTAPGKNILDFGVTSVKEKKSSLKDVMADLNKALKHFGADAAERSQPKPTQNFPSTPMNADNNLKDDDRLDSIVFCSIILDSVYNDFLKIKNSNITLANIYDTANRKLTGKRQSPSKEKKKNIKNRNTIDGAQTHLQPIMEMILRCGNNITLDKVQLFLDNNLIKKNAPFSVGATAGLHGGGIAPTSLVRAKIGEIVTADMLFTGTAPLPASKVSIDSSLINKHDNNTQGGY